MCSRAAACDGAVRNCWGAVPDSVNSEYTTLFRTPPGDHVAPLTLSLQCFGALEAAGWTDIRAVLHDEQAAAIDAAYFAQLAGHPVMDTRPMGHGKSRIAIGHLVMQVLYAVTPGTAIAAMVVPSHLVQQACRETEVMFGAGLEADVEILVYTATHRRCAYYASCASVRRRLVDGEWCTEVVREKTVIVGDGAGAACRRAWGKSVRVVELGPKQELALVVDEFNFSVNGDLCSTVKMILMCLAVPTVDLVEENGKMRLVEGLEGAPLRRSGTYVDRSMGTVTPTTQKGARPQCYCMKWIGRRHGARLFMSNATPNAKKTTANLLVDGEVVTDDRVNASVAMVMFCGALRAPITLLDHDATSVPPVTVVEHSLGMECSVLGRDVCATCGGGKDMHEGEELSCPAGRPRLWNMVRVDPEEEEDVDSDGETVTERAPRVGQVDPLIPDVFRDSETFTSAMRRQIAHLVSGAAKERARGNMLEARRKLATAASYGNLLKHIELMGLIDGAIGAVRLLLKKHLHLMVYCTDRTARKELRSALCALEESGDVGAVWVLANAADAIDRADLESVDPRKPTVLLAGSRYATGANLDRHNVVKQNADDVVAAVLDLSPDVRLHRQIPLRLVRAASCPPDSPNFSDDFGGPVVARYLGVAVGRSDTVGPLEWPAGGQNLRVVERIAELSDEKFPMLRAVDGELVASGISITGAAASAASDDDACSSVDFE